MTSPGHPLLLLAGLVGSSLAACATEPELESPAAEEAEVTESAAPGEAVASPAVDPGAPPPTKPGGSGGISIQAQCGPTWDSQPIEQYDGSAGVPRYFTAFHESRVGFHTNGCSGTLISDDLFISAGHCNYAVGDTVMFDYQHDPNDTPRPATYVSVTEVVEQEYNVNWNYAIVRLSDSPGREFGHANISAADPASGTTVTVIGHPAGGPKHVHAGPVVTISAPQGPNWLSYWVDTQPENAGSGILDPSGRLIGIHTSDGCEGYPFAGNSGMRMSSLLTHSPTLISLNRSKVLWRYSGSSLASLWTVSAGNAYVNSTTYEPGIGWTPLTYSNNHLVWRNNDGRISYWTLSDTNAYGTAREHGPYAGWTAISAANDRVLWRDGTTGDIWLWTVDSVGNYVSAVSHTIAAGWSPVNYANNHILWRHTSGLTSLWRVDDAGNFVSAADFNPGAGWVPLSYENGQILWRHTDGRISVWNLSRDNTHLSQAVTAAVNNRTALMLSDRKIAWRHTPGDLQLSNVNSYGDVLNSTYHAVSLSWIPVAIAGARP